MTNRKFTPPTEFPAEYVISDGRKAVLCGIVPHKDYAFVGYVEYAKDLIGPALWSEYGSAPCANPDIDLYDLSKKQVHWANDYNNGCQIWLQSREEADQYGGLKRIAVIRREWIEGQPPQYFTEEV